MAALTQQAFVEAMLARFEALAPGQVDRAYAANVLDGFLEMEGGPGPKSEPMAYGAEGYDWTAEGARDLADEDMGEWEQG